MPEWVQQKAYRKSQEPLIKSSADCVAGKMRVDARRATKVVAGTTTPRRARVALHLRSCAAERAVARRIAVARTSARLRGRTYRELHAPASTTQTPHFTAIRRDGACPGGLLCRSACQGEWPLAAPRFAHPIPESRRRNRVGFNQRFHCSPSAKTGFCGNIGGTSKES